MTENDRAARWAEAKRNGDLAALAEIGDEALRELGIDPNPPAAPEPEPEGVRYPDVDVTLVGVDSHPFAIIKAVSDGLRAAGVGARERDEFRDEALGGDYDNVIQTAMRWVNVS